MAARVSTKDMVTVKEEEVTTVEVVAAVRVVEVIVAEEAHPSNLLLCLRLR